MDDVDVTASTAIVPRRIRTYLTVNVGLAVLMTVVMAVRAELRTGRYLLIDLFLVGFYSTVLASIFAAPFGLVQVYLYRRQKGALYDWQHRTRRRGRDDATRSAERRYWRSEAIRARLTHGSPIPFDPGNRTSLFEHESAADEVSRPALLMKVADRFEQSGKREAAERCYCQITDQFPQSPQAREAAHRLASFSPGSPRHGQT